MASARIHEAVAKEINKEYKMDEILFGPFNADYSGCQTSSWDEIPSIIEKIVDDK